MLLAIDVGNTNSVFAIHDGTAYLADWRCATARAATRPRSRRRSAPRMAC